MDIVLEHKKSMQNSTFNNKFKVNFKVFKVLILYKKKDSEKRKKENLC